MEVFEDAWRRSDLPVGTVGTIGNYDGVHLGQQAILRCVTESARELGLPAVVVTFDPHPRHVLSREGAPPRLTTDGQKRRLLTAAGVDALAVVRFDEELAATSAESFVELFLVDRLGMRRVFVGERFAFGRRREGTFQRLAEIGARHRLEASGVAEVRVGAVAVSSTRIRRAVADGDLELARRLLGRPFALEGEVVHGDGRGRRLGWPTANIAVAEQLLPADGVYAAGFAAEDGEGPVRAGVANIGVRPTVGGAGERVAEVHLFDFAGDLYGLRGELLLCRRLRGERRFPDLAALERQIARDAASAREYLSENRCWQPEERVVEPAIRNEMRG